MHPNPAFRGTDTITALSFASSIGFGTLAVNGEDHPLLSHIPFVIDGDSATLHLVRSNPIARLAQGPVKAKLAIVGPHSYVSPDWYGAEDQVPTWNYAAVHLIGTLCPMASGGSADVLEDLSDEFETRLLPKPVWKATKMDPEALGRMMRMIQPFRLDIDDVQSTFKLGQNKPDAMRQAAASQLAKHGIGSEVETLAAMMTTIQSEESR